MRLIPLMCETCHATVVVNRDTECFCRIHSQLNYKLRLKKQIIFLFDRALRSPQQRSQNTSANCHRLQQRKRSGICPWRPSTETPSHGSTTRVDSVAVQGRGQEATAECVSPVVTNSGRDGGWECAQSYDLETTMTAEG